MTDTLDTKPAPHPRVRSRTRPAPRSSPADRRHDPPESETPPSWFLNWLESQATSQRSAQFIESQPDPAPAPREADPEELTPFIATIRARATAPQGEIKHERPYNYPLRWYVKHDGMVVELQGDPNNRAMYRGMGYHELTPAEVQTWLGGERQKVVAIQREKAEIINSLREQVLRDPNLKASISSATEMAWDHMSVAELESFRDEVLGIPDQSGKPRRKLRPPQRLIDAENKRAQAEADRLMAGVETAPSRRAIEAGIAPREVEPSIPERFAGPGRDIEVTPTSIRTFR